MRRLDLDQDLGKTSWGSTTFSLPCQPAMHIQVWHTCAMLQHPTIHFTMHDEQSPTDLLTVSTNTPHRLGGWQCASAHLAAVLHYALHQAEDVRGLDSIWHQLQVLQQQSSNHGR